MFSVDTCLTIRNDSPHNRHSCGSALLAVSRSWVKILLLVNKFDVTVLQTHESEVWYRQSKIESGIILTVRFRMNNIHYECHLSYLFKY